MSDLISRQDAIDELRIEEELLKRVLDDMDVVRQDREKYSWGLELINSCISDIEELPSAEPVKHWKWIRDEFGSKCGHCGLYAYRDKFDKPWESPYCPICGARMDEE
jgi:hypothetical protein